MATSYLHPGVYVENVTPPGAPIQGVETDIAAFVGFALIGPRNVPTRITGWLQYLDVFGGFAEGYYLPHAVHGFFLNGGTRCYVVNVAPPTADQGMVPGVCG